MKKHFRESDSHRSSHNNILQTKIAVLLLTFLVTLSMTACTSLNGLSKERAGEITEASDALQVALETAFTEAEEPADLLAPLIDFADENEIYYKTVNDNAIIFIKKAEEETAESLNVTMHCSIGEDDPADAASKAAAVLTALDESSTST